MGSRRLAVVALVAAFVAVLSGAPARASDKADVMATVHQFIDGFNKGDVKSALATCADPVSILDEFPPYAWQGPTACLDWSNAYDADAKANGITDGIVILGTPWHVDVTGDRAYVVGPATYTYKQHGRPVTEANAVYTLALHKVAAGWRITAWAWSRH
jgi:ketosteroid isomerase-like protein